MEYGILRGTKVKKNVMSWKFTTNDNPPLSFCYNYCLESVMKKLAEMGWRLTVSPKPNEFIFEKPQTKTFSDVFDEVWRKDTESKNKEKVEKVKHMNQEQLRMIKALIKITETNMNVSPSLFEREQWSTVFQGLRHIENEEHLK